MRTPCRTHPEIFEKACAQIARAPDAAAGQSPASAEGDRRADCWLESTLDESSRRTLRAASPSSA